jgi:hypothetical protein
MFSKNNAAAALIDVTTVLPKNSLKMSEEILKLLDETGAIEGMIFDCDSLVDSTQAHSRYVQKANCELFALNKCAIIYIRAWKQTCNLYSLKPLSMKKCRDNLGRSTRDIVEEALTKCEQVICRIYHPINLIVFCEQPI